MVRPLCSLWCSCGFHVHRTPHFRSFQYTTIYDVDLRLFELKSWCSRVMLHSTRLGPVKISALSLRSALWCWIAKMRTDLSVPWGWSTQAAEDKWRWNHSDMGRIGPESEMNGWDCLPFERSTSNFAFQVGRWTRWDRMGTNTDKTLYYALSIFW